MGGLGVYHNLFLETLHLPLYGAEVKFDKVNYLLETCSDSKLLVYIMCRDFKSRLLKLFCSIG
jgi:hypothetical protein